MGFAVVPAFDVIDQRGIVQELLGALSMGYAPSTPLAHWFELLAFIALGWAAARVAVAISAHGSRRELLWFTGAAGSLLTLYVFTTGAWITGLLAAACLVTGVTELLSARSAVGARAPDAAVE